jgi:hypothetical protein
MKDNARKLDRGKAIEPGFHVSFEDPADFFGGDNAGSGAIVARNLRRARVFERLGTGPRT